MKQFFILTLLLISITCISSLANPGNIGFGLTGGYLNASNDVHYVYNCESCALMESFRQGGYFAGITIEYPLSIGLESSIISRVYFNTFSYLYFVMGDEYPSIVDDGNGGYKTVNSQTRWDWTGENSLLSLDILPKIIIPYLKLGVYAGISVSYLVNSSYTELYRMIKPEYVQFKVVPGYESKGYRYADKNRTVYLKEGEIPYKNDFRYAVKAGLTYDFDFWGMRLSPFVTMDFPLSDVVSSVNMDCAPAVCLLRKNAHWRITYYQAGLDLKYLF